MNTDHHQNKSFNCAESVTKIPVCGPKKDANPSKKQEYYDGRPVGTRTPDLYRVKVAL
jgi:hypothetical protein